MAANASKVRTQMDTAAGVTLRDITDTPETATALETGVSLGELDAAYWHGGEIPHGVFLVTIHVSAIDQTSDETYVLNILVDDVSTLDDTPTTIASYTLTDLDPGVFVMAIDSKTIPLLDTESSGSDKFIGIQAVLAGTTPSITYGAWIGRNVSA